jgi:23S rRNA (guanine745-N1)-methyltransferase
MGKLRCPVCKKELNENTLGLVCAKGHRFDRASSGYVNLTIGSKQRKSGDDKSMIAARSLFLSQGYYLPLREGIIDCLKRIPFQSALDMGCGEGYYTNTLSDSFLDVDWIGVDLSVDAIKFASKQTDKVRYLVANISDLPIQDHSIDLAINIFAPIFTAEIDRILTVGGYALFVLPGEDHLFELKERLYSEVRLNPAPISEMTGYETIFIQDIDFTFDIRSNADLLALLHMTPYVHRSPKENIRLVEKLDTLHVRASFRILCVSKSKNYDTSN